MRETKLLSMEHIWQEGMKDNNGQIPKRMIDDKLEENFWNQHICKRSHNDFIDSYTIDVSRALLTYIEETDSVIEIGPGWGNYTFTLAKKANHVTCIEPSESCLQFLREVSELNQHSISFVQKKWEDYSRDEKVDVVVGINCFYRMFDIKKALLLMNQISSKRAIIGMTTAPMRPHYLDLARDYGVKLTYPKRDYLHLYHLLYELGIYANCTMIPLKKTYTFQSYEQLIAKNSVRLATQIDSKLIERSLLPYIEEKDGTYYYTHSFYAALIDWQPVSSHLGFPIHV
ncbi:class I SAM-dependent methyltransferase [Bacillus solitudinis]|uniref:class I SAM-dependent methyltransferase n=1 Tax=Bacillus solitudinis TaxID=2014074 RepID=UPI000C236931|nr:class I SAM-dependent methyltransferase [Bacillus solitudinis]